MAEVLFCSNRSDRHIICVALFQLVQPYHSSNYSRQFLTMKTILTSIHSIISNRSTSKQRIGFLKTSKLPSSASFTSPTISTKVVSKNAAATSMLQRKILHQSSPSLLQLYSCASVPHYSQSALNIQLLLPSALPSSNHNQIDIQVKREKKRKKPGGWGREEDAYWWRRRRQGGLATELDRLLEMARELEVRVEQGSPATARDLCAAGRLRRQRRPPRRHWHPTWRRRHWRQAQEEEGGDGEGEAAGEGELGARPGTTRRRPLLAQVRPEGHPRRQIPKVTIHSHACDPDLTNFGFAGHT